MRMVLVLVAWFSACLACDGNVSHGTNRATRELPSGVAELVPEDQQNKGTQGKGESTQSRPNKSRPNKGKQGKSQPSKGKQGKDQPNKSKQGSAIAQMQALFDKEKITVDAKNKTVSIPVVVNRLMDFLEYLLIHRHGKAHESLLITECKPSILNAALLLIGFEEGQNFALKDKAEKPSIEQLKAGVSPYVEVAPKGMPVYMTVTMKLASGKSFEVPVEDLVMDLATGQAVRDMTWVFLGSRMAMFVRGEPKQFAADMEGNLVSVCYRRPKNHIATGHHARARDDHNWAVHWAKADKDAGLGQFACPPIGTELTLTFYRNMPKVLQARAKRLPPPTKPASKPARQAGDGR